MKTAISRMGTATNSAAPTRMPVNVSAATKAKKKQVASEVSRTVVLKMMKMASGGPARKSWMARKYCFDQWLL